MIIIIIIIIIISSYIQNFLCIFFALSFFFYSTIIISYNTREFIGIFLCVCKIKKRYTLFWFSRWKRHRLLGA